MKIIVPSTIPLSLGFLALFMAGLCFISGCVENETGLPSAGEDSAATVSFPLLEPDTSTQLKEFFASLNYDWSNVDEGIPPFILGKFPEDLGHSGSVEEKKRLFFLGLVPMVLYQNQEIMRQRETLLESFRLWDRGDTLTAERKTWISNLASDYKIEGNPLIDRKVRRRLLKRVDIIPPSIALAQAASESAYGTSRFSRQGNNLFGEWTYVQGAGLVPKNRTPGLTHEVRKFSTLLDSVKSYMANLNTHRAYFPFREKRALFRARGLAPSGPILTDGLRLYSERGEAYVRDIVSIIRQNDLLQFANAKLRSIHATDPQKTDALGAGLLSSRLFSSRQSALGDLGINP